MSKGVCGTRRRPVWPLVSALGRLRNAVRYDSFETNVRASVKADFT